ncbi:ATP-dependent nuclease [Chitinophaga eiseniae]|uniref:AAA family ATPase n=1 Tax=Chitinophaga eiseniae TaxID=634771 RepID=A0A847SUR2_9BACT|nr:ATP-dependent endonuclease [Chitinophaga eiseniae]NLR82028.1 AAA family ATPase [Chitinophaga eiseniae]
MRISKIEIENFRLLKNFSMDLENELSLVIGKNNMGKTSILLVLEKFLNPSDGNRFSFDDFNTEYKKMIKVLIEDPILMTEEDYKPLGIKMRLFIEYNQQDNLSNISRLMMDLNPLNNVIVLGFEYSLEYRKYHKMKDDFKKFQTSEEQKVKKDNKYKPKSAFDFLKHRQEDFFSLIRKSLEYNIETKTVNESVFLNLGKEQISIKDVINFKYISARRDVTNKDVDKTLSTQTSRIYEKTESPDEQNKAVEDFKDKLSETDDHLSGIYKTLFNGIVEKVRNFGGVKINESDIEIISTLQHRELLKGNTTVVYKHDEDSRLPEHYNGLGYMNLISMIFEIEILVHEFKRETEKIPADINLLFIEEPEAHTHPQMQYVFIKNIKALLSEGIKRNDGIKRKLQYIISTHSAHIVADSDFDDIKYLTREASGVIAKNLKDLSERYSKNPKYYHFLTQYLTISRAEIFFAEKAILIEGDTERILIPTLMRKIDIEEREKFSGEGESDRYLPLLSQNISIVEVGAYSHVFEVFIDFLGMKTLIITDLDAVCEDGNSCEVSKGKGYSNASIRHFYDSPSLEDLTNRSFDRKCLRKESDKWVIDRKGNLCIVYQVEEDGYNARSFEDAYIHINKGFIKDNKQNFAGLKLKEHFDNGKSAYFLAENCIKKKTHFAMDIIYQSDSNLSNWKIPAYIKEGLLWLKED